MRLLLLCFALAGFCHGQMLQPIVAGKSTAPALPTDFGSPDFLVDMNTGSVGDQISTTNMTAGTKGTSNIGSWSSITGAGAAYTIGASKTNCPLPSALYINGTQVAAAATSKSLSIDNTTALHYSIATSPFNGIRKVAGVFCFVPGQNSVAPGSDVLFDKYGFVTSGGKFVIAQMRNGACGGTSGYGLTLHTLHGGVAFQAGCFTLTQNVATRCYIAGDFSASTNNTDTLACFDASSGSALGSTITDTGADGGSDVTEFHIGNAEAGTSSGTTSFLQNAFAWWRGYYPSSVNGTVTTDYPVSVVSHLYNTAQLSTSTTSTVSATYGQLSGTAIIVAFEAEKTTAVTISSVTDTAGNTYTCDAGGVAEILGTNGGSMHVCYAKNATANAANAVTVNHTSSAFRNLEVFQLKGANTTAPIDVYGTGTVPNAGGTANCTTSSFTPTSANSLSLLFSYVTAAVVQTSGTNYFQSWTSSTTSQASAIRTQPPTSSQTAQMVQASTNTKWCVAVVVKQ